MSNNDMSLKYLGLDLTATSDGIEQAITKRSTELRAAIARGERDGQQATTEFARHCVGARRWAKEQAEFAEQRAAKLAAADTRMPAAAPALTACNACRHQISVAALSCPNCGHPTRQPTASSITAPSGKAKRDPLNAVQLLFLLVGGVLLLAMCSQLPSSPGTQNNSGYWYGAKTACHDAVRARLKAPASAVFGTIDEYGNSSNNEVREIRGSVDSQNSFGAALRKQYVCSISGQSVTSVQIN